MDNSVYWAVALKNSICMVCWAGLAVFFNHWWIALFSILCFTSIERKSKEREEENVGN